MMGHLSYDLLTFFFRLYWLSAKLRNLSGLSLTNDSNFFPPSAKLVLILSNQYDIGLCDRSYFGHQSKSKSISIINEWGDIITKL